MPTPSTRRLTYANVVSTFALVLALGGTGAYAAQLAKNSVGSKQIKNDSVTGADLKNRNITAADVKPDSLTGAQIRESTLGAVPNADRLGGQAASAFNRTSSTVKGGFVEGSPLQANVAGFGSVYLYCDDNNTVGNLADDVMGVGYQLNMGPGGVAIQQAAYSASPTLAPEWVLYNSINSSSGTSVDKDSRVTSEFYLSNGAGTQVFLVRLWGYNDSNAFGCNGIIETTRLH
jgi:hypothetical protein